MSKVNENIRKFRMFRQLSQKKLGEQLSKSANVISNWETGTHSPDLDTIQDICKILKVTPNELFGWEENREYKAYMRELAAANTKLEKLIDQRNALNAEIELLNRKMRDRLPNEVLSDKEKEMELFNEVNKLREHINENYSKGMFNECGQLPSDA